MNSVICFCYGITIEDLEFAVLNGAGTPEKVMKVTGAGDGCTSCQPDLEVIVPALVRKIKTIPGKDGNTQLSLF